MISIELMHNVLTNSDEYPEMCVCRGVNFFMLRTLEGLVDKGVKVDIGIPHELWNKPSAEITQVRMVEGRDGKRSVCEREREKKIIFER